MEPRQRSVSSSLNSKKLMRPQRAEQSKNAVKPASGDVYSNTLNLSSMLIGQPAKDSGAAISNRSIAQSSRDQLELDSNGDDLSHSYIAHEVEEILNVAGSKGSAKDAETQVRSYVY